MSDRIKSLSNLLYFKINNTTSTKLCTFLYSLTVLCNNVKIHVHRFEYIYTRIFYLKIFTP